jgi:polysaccharide biosynthesis/export protein
MSNIGLQHSRTYAKIAALIPLATGFRSAVFAALAIAATLSAANAAGEAYHLRAGDVLEISVSGFPELRERTPIQLDGTINSPNFGTLSAENATLSEIRARIRSALASKVFRVHTPDGRESSRVVERDDVAVVVAEYKPIYVGGDVAHPGEQRFRPRMTVRQALIVAGGPAIAPLSSLIDLPALRAEYVSKWLALVREEARLWRTKTELGNNVEFDQKVIPPAPVSEPSVSQIIALETEYRTTRNSDYERAKKFFQRAIKEADLQSQVLADELQKEEAGLQADTDDLQHLKELNGKGLAPNSRVADARRAVLLSSTRALQTRSQLIQVKRARTEHARELEKLDDQRRMSLLAEQEEATTKVAEQRTNLQSIAEKIQSAGAQPPRASDDAGKMELTVFRRGLNGTKRLTVDSDTELQPGDVIEVGSDHVKFAGR